MSYFDYRIQEHIVESADGEYVLGRDKVFTETTSDRVVKKENGDKYIDLSVHNEKPYGIDLLKEAVSKNPWLGCDYHIEPGEALKFAKVINRFIDTDDHFIYLGDFDDRHHDPDFNLLKTFFGALKCRNVYLILGNNDSFPIRKYRELGIRAVTDTFEFENVLLSHFPVKVESPKINIHGHLHGAGSPTQKGPKAYWYADPKRCVDVWRDDFTPLRLNDVLTNWKQMQKYESHNDGKMRLIGESVDINDYGIPEEKKYPLDSKQHVISAIKLFGHVDKKYEEELADNIIRKIEYYNLKDEVKVGEDNRFKKYFDNYYSEEVLENLRGELLEEKNNGDDMNMNEKYEEILTEEADYNQKNTYPVYIILTDADSPMAKMIKRYTGQPYAHALVSFNEDLEPAYSFGCTSIKPLRFGFISKGEEDPFRNEEKAAYVVYAMYVTKTQYAKIQKKIQWFIDNKDKLDYAWGGLAFFGLQIPKQFKNQYFCSQFVMQIVGEAVPLSKDPSLWSPGDIEYLTNISLVDKGDDLRKFDKRRFKRNLRYLKKHQFDRLKAALESVQEDDIYTEAEEALNPNTSHFLLQKIGKRVDVVLADPKSVKAFVTLVQNFINRNITKLTKSGPCDMIPFTDTDHEAFHSLFGFWYTIDPRANKTSPNEIREIIDEYSKRAHIKCDFWKNNSSLMLFYFVIRYFTMKNDSKNLNTALAIYTLCNYPVMFHKYFPNGVMEPYMQYTIDNMTEKFIIKKSKHLFDALMTSIQASYKFHKGNFPSATDKKVGDWINRIRNDQNSMMKKISNEYMKNYKEGNAARTSNEEYDSDTPIVDEMENGTTVVQNLVQRVTLPIIEDGVDLVRAEAAAKMSQVSVSDCRYFLTLIITDSNADTIQKFIESLLFLYIYEGKKTERDIRSQYFLAWSASLFKKTNSKNKNINTINEILNFWAESTGLYKKFAGKTSRINYKKAIFFYLVLCIQKNV